MTDEMFKLFKEYKNYKIIHLGDYCIKKELLDKYDVLTIKGNCDFEGIVETELIDNDMKMFITHGDKYNVKMRLDRIYYKALEEDCNYILFGHTHYPVCEELNGVYILNPGSLVDNSYITIENGVAKLHR